MGNLKCGISQKRMIVERNGRKFGTRGTAVYICRVLLIPDSLSSVQVGIIQCTYSALNIRAVCDDLLSHDHVAMQPFTSRQVR